MAKKTPTQKLERLYTVPLRRGFLKTSKYKRSKKAVKVLKEFIAKHMKSDNINIGADVNELIWKNGIKNPPPRVKILATKEDDKVSVILEANKKDDVKKAKTEKPKADSKATVKEAKEEPAKEAKTEEPKAKEEPAKEVKKEAVKEEKKE
jgi:large subunit ribosomal protein L31e